ncbi:MAG: hypothetical protein K0V04_17515 [Deltaproteobacteria bacterium]|nr:hypothetical protein [Deltaproteobacteria bacterium]
MALIDVNRTRRALRTGLALGALLGLSACDFTDTGRTGELGHGYFFYECDNNPDDGFCDRAALDREFPAAVAVGSMFKIDFEADDGTEHLDLVSGCLDCLQRTTEGFTMPAPGRAPLLAENGEGEIFDILHVEAKDTADIVVRVDGEPWPDGQLVLLPTTMHDLTATPQAADGTELGGALAYSWEIADESIVQFSSSSARNDVSLIAITPGETTITVSTGDISFEIPVEVKEIG